MNDIVWCLKGECFAPVKTTSCWGWICQNKKKMFSLAFGFAFGSCPTVLRESLTITFSLQRMVNSPFFVLWKIFGPQFRLRFVISRLLRCSPLIVHDPMFNFPWWAPPGKLTYSTVGKLGKSPIFKGRALFDGVRAKEGTDPRINPPTRKWRRTTIYKPQNGHLEGDETDHHGYLVRNDSCCWDDPPKKWTWTSPTPPPPGSFVSLPSILCQVKNGWNGLQQGWRMPVFLILGDIQKRIYLWEKYGKVIKNCPGWWFCFLYEMKEYPVYVDKCSMEIRTKWSVNLEVHPSWI